MAYHRLKHSFSSGELSPLMYSRPDFERYQNGSRVLQNMVCTTQGPCTRRPGTKFIYDLEDLGFDTTDPQLRAIPFVFSELQSCALIFFMHTDGTPRVVFGTGDGLLYNAGVVVLTLGTAWDIENFDYAQSADDMYIAQSGMQMAILSRTGLYTWTWSLLTFTSQPVEWVAPLSWPRTVGFHQQRLVFGGNLSNRQTVWMTKAGDFTSFAVSSPVVADDAVVFTLDSGTQNSIKWINSSRGLSIGTLGDEWTVTGGGNNAITPTNVLAERQTKSGSEALKPLDIGRATMFLERHGRVVNEFTYEYSQDSYQNLDMVVLAPHLTEFYSIVDWTYQRTPDSIVWCVREDGEIIAVTYQKQHKVVGWHHHVTQGEFKAITCIPGEDREDDVWMVVKRSINSVDKYFIEKLATKFSSEDAVDSDFLDCHVVYDGVATSTITGLDHLIGEEVQILADGTVHPPLTVDVSGEIELNNDYSKVVVGFGFVSEVRPLSQDVPTNNGTALGRHQRILELDISLYRSLGMQVGRVSDGVEKVETQPFRVPSDLTGVAVPLYTGVYTMKFMEGWDREGVYFIRQSQPLPLTVLSITDVIKVSE